MHVAKFYNHAQKLYGVYVAGFSSLAAMVVGVAVLVTITSQQAKPLLDYWFWL